MVGRELRKDEEVHHIDADRTNFWFTNLLVLGGEDHGWVSAKQAHFMRTTDDKEKVEWDAFIDSLNKEQRFGIADPAGFVSPPDGSIREEWEREYGNRDAERKGLRDGESQLATRY